MGWATFDEKFIWTSVDGRWLLNIELEKKRRAIGAAFLDCKPGGVLLSHELAPAVPSALRGLTTEFGMGSGVSPSPWPPECFGKW